MKYAYTQNDIVVSVSYDQPLLTKTRMVPSEGPDGEEVQIEEQYREPDPAYVECGDEVCAGFTALNGVFTAPAPLPVIITPDDITRERDRRIEAGFDVSLTGFTGTVALQGRPEDKQNLHGLFSAAQMRIAQNIPGVMVFRDRNNVVHSLSPAQMIELWYKGGAWIERQYKNAWNLKDLIEAGMDVSDYADDQYWPA